MLLVDIPPPKHPWLCIYGTDSNGIEHDVTDLVNEKIEDGQIIDAKWLDAVTGVCPEIWEYMDSSTFDVHQITSDGIVNEVKPKAD